MCKNTETNDRVDSICLTGFFFAPEKKAKKGNLPYTEASQVEPLNKAPDQPLSLWYNKPATYWEEALPVGNGRLGAMVYGGVSKEIIQMNEDTLWAGPPVPTVKKNEQATIDK